MTVTLAEVKNLIEEAVEKERKRVAEVVRNAKAQERDYYDRRMSFSETMRVLSYEIDPASKPDWAE